MVPMCVTQTGTNWPSTSLADKFGPALKCQGESFHGLRRCGCTAQNMGRDGSKLSLERHCESGLRSNADVGSSNREIPGFIQSARWRPVAVAHHRAGPEISRLGSRFALFSRMRSQLSRLPRVEFYMRVSGPAYSIPCGVLRTSAGVVQAKATTIYIDSFTCNIAGFLRAQKRNDIADFTGIACATQWRA